MKKEFEVISKIIKNNKRVLDVPEFLKTISEFLHSTYDEINNEKRI